MDQRRVIIFTPKELARELRPSLEAFSAQVVFVAPESEDAAKALSGMSGDALVTVAKCPNGFKHLGDEGWFDYLNGLNQRFKVVVLGSLPDSVSGRNFRKLELVPDLEGVEGVLVRLRAQGVLQPEVIRKLRSRIPELNVDELCGALRKDSILSLICINATKLRKMATSLGNDVFEQVVAEVRQSLLEMWGEPGSFRAEDILCHKREDSLVFYLVLHGARGQDPVPAPGVLERLGERITAKLLGRLWRKIGNGRAAKDGHGLPSCVRMIPEIAAGHATVVYNPCVNGREQIVQLLESALDSARGQLLRVSDRQRELLLTILKSDELIEPAFQAVFSLENLDLTDASRFKEGNALRTSASAIFGFESLIRLKANYFDRRFFPDPVSFFEGRILQPDVLFALAHHVHLALELDQACLRHALKCSAGLPGALMVNILPRNLYHVDAIKEWIGDRANVVLEVSESEEIGNFDKLGEVCGLLRKQNLKVAADDFGKGFAGLDRILKMRPDLIKIDRGLVSEIDLDPARQTFMKSLLAAAKVAGSSVLAEGIERIEEARFCQENGVDLVQGFLFHKPQFRSDLNVVLGLGEKNGSAVNNVRRGRAGKLPGAA